MGQQWGRYIQVNPDKIKQVAAQAQTEAEELRRKRDFAHAESTTAASHHSEGFLTAGALPGCLREWESNVGRLAGSIQGVHDKLVQTANNYLAADERGAARIREAGQRPQPGSGY